MATHEKKVTKKFPVANLGYQLKNQVACCNFQWSMGYQATVNTYSALSTPLLVEKAGVAPEMALRFTMQKEVSMQAREPPWL